MSNQLNCLIHDIITFLFTMQIIVTGWCCYIVVWRMTKSDTRQETKLEGYFLEVALVEESKHTV